MFELTYQCNFNCKHCYVPKSYRKIRELKTKEVFSVLDELKKIGCFYLGFTGGEPFVRKDIMQILWYAKRKGFEIIIYTNGSLIDKTAAKELKRIRVNKVDITIPAMSKPAFERISGVSGSWEKVFAAINFLRENKVPLGFKTCVLKENESEIKGIQDFARSLGALHRLDDMLSRRLDGSEEPFKYRGTIAKCRTSSHSECSPQGEAKNPDDKILRSAVGLPQNDGNGTYESISVNSRLFECGVGVSQAAITPLGELKPCLMIDSPRFRILREKRGQSADFKVAWLQLKKFVSAIAPDENYNCNKCKLQTYCKWCPARSWLYNKNFTSCEPESRKNARNSIQNF
ncbi:MAG: radical SAM protein [Candidatus Omnitrophica bacterium]|nr:radical SAM protein [Candidatus Omnitrophota bacterium]MCG2707526.1 radical SAM protein [Candidatus Omnitrophota bacterium]